MLLEITDPRHGDHPMDGNSNKLSDSSQVTPPMSPVSDMNGQVVMEFPTSMVSQGYLSVPMSPSIALDPKHSKSDLSSDSESDSGEKSSDEGAKHLGSKAQRSLFQETAGDSAELPESSSSASRQRPSNNNNNNSSSVHSISQGVGAIQNNHLLSSAKPSSFPSAPSGSAGNSAIQEPPEKLRNADYYHARGFSHRKRGDFNAAISDYSKAIDLDPGHFKSYFNRGFSYDKLGDYDKAIENYTLALKVSTRPTHGTPPLPRYCFINPLDL